MSYGNAIMNAELNEISGEMVLNVLMKMIAIWCLWMVRLMTAVLAETYSELKCIF
jgi:hypothetical protein